jgi:hypothetical protein
MPIKSKAQQRLMYATTGGAKTGVPKKVAKEYIEATPKKAMKQLPERKSSKVVLRKKSAP